MKNTYGFTLVELLVSITIVGILVSMSFSNFLSYREKAYDTQAIMELNNAYIEFNSTLADITFPVGSSYLMIIRADGTETGPITKATWLPNLVLSEGMFLRLWVNGTGHATFPETAALSVGSCNGSTSGNQTKLFYRFHGSQAYANHASTTFNISSEGGTLYSWLTSLAPYNCP